MDAPLRLARQVTCREVADEAGEIAWRNGPFVDDAED
jgi:hypothetical protein